MYPERPILSNAVRLIETQQHTLHSYTGSTSYDPLLEMLKDDPPGKKIMAKVEKHQEPVYTVVRGEPDEDTKPYVHDPPNPAGPIDILRYNEIAKPRFYLKYSSMLISRLEKVEHPLTREFEVARYYFHACCANRIPRGGLTRKHRLLDHTADALLDFRQWEATLQDLEDEKEWSAKLEHFDRIFQYACAHPMSSKSHRF